MTRGVFAGGRAAQLRISGSRAEFTPDGGTGIEREFTFCRFGPGRFLVILDGRSYRVSLGPRSEAAVNGRVLDIEVFDPRDRRGGAEAGSRGGRKEVAAPMPGKVIRVLVTAGESVREGQGLIVVEAMKMQNEMKSPKAGTVVEIRTSAEETVGAGDVLVVVE